MVEIVRVAEQEKAVQCRVTLECVIDKNVGEWGEREKAAKVVQGGVDIMKKQSIRCLQNIHTATMSSIQEVI